MSSRRESRREHSSDYHHRKHKNKHKDDEHNHKRRRKEKYDAEDSHNVKCERRNDKYDSYKERNHNYAHHDHGKRRRHDNSDRDYDNHNIKKSRSHQREFNNSESRFGHEDAETSSPSCPKQEANMGLSGKLAEDTNTYKGVVIKYSEPPEARKPKRRWRLYQLKDDKELPILHIHRQSAYLLGRERKIADIPIDHPSCSKQHAVLQYRLVEYSKVDGSAGRQVKPYIIDLGSANGTYVNSKRIDSEHYVELIEKDVIKFGYSSRDYVLLHDQSQVSEEIDAGLD